MNTIRRAAALALLAGAANAQPFPVGHLQQTFTDTSRANRQVPCEIYYPAATAGNNMPVAPGKFPVLVFGHGFVMAWSAYNIYWSALVPSGYIMVFPTTESSLFPSHVDFGRDLAFLCGEMKRQGVTTASAFYGSIDTASAVMGHSMGGGCAFLAMQYDSSITALAALAPAVTSPSSVAAASSVTRPALVMAGSNDCVAPPSAHQVPMYDSLASACKSYISISGGDHCQFASYNFNCSFGQSTCSPQATIGAATQQALVFSCLAPWLDFYLKGNCAAAGLFQGLVAAGNGIATQQNCSLSCGPAAVAATAPPAGYAILSDPVSKAVILFCESALAGRSFTVFSADGRALLRGKITSRHTALPTGHLPPGPCLVRVDGLPARRFVITE